MDNSETAEIYNSLAKRDHKNSEITGVSTGVGNTNITKWAVGTTLEEWITLQKLQKSTEITHMETTTWMNTQI